MTPEDTYYVESLEQLRLLADPLRLRLLEAFAEEPRTTKQVAESWGEKPTRLYHHVSQLADAGLLELVETRPVRGAREKYYRAAGHHFAVAHDLLAGKQGADSRRALFEGLIAETRRGVLRSIEVADGEVDGVDARPTGGRPADEPADDCPEGMPLVAHARVNASPARARELRESLMALLDEPERQGETSNSAGEERQAWGLTIAFYPIAPD